MRRVSIGLLTLTLTLVLSATAWAGGGGGSKGPKFDWKNSKIIKVADDFVSAIAAADYEAAYKSGGDILREHRTLEEFTTDIKNWGFDKPGSVEWTAGNNALPANNGFKLMGTFTPKLMSFFFSLFFCIK